LNRALWLIALSMFAWGVGDGMFINFQPLYLQQLGADPVQIGAILGLVQVVATLSHILGGALTNRLGAKKVMMTASIIGATGAWMMFLARDLRLFTLSLAILYFSWLEIVPMSSYITHVPGEWTFTRTITSVFAGYYVGSIIGPSIGGQIASEAGIRTVIGLTAAVFTITPLSLSLLPAAPGKPDPGAARYRELWSNSAFLYLLPLMVFAALAMFLNWPLTPNFLRNVRQVSLRSIGIFGSINAVGGLLLSLTLGRLSPYPAFLIAQASVLGASVMLWLGGSAAWYGLGYFFASGYRVANTLALALVRPLLRDAEVGVAYGVLYAAMGTSVLLAAPLAGVLYDLRPSLPYPVSVALIALSMLLFGLFMPLISKSWQGTNVSSKDNMR
jgi:predicted MFS family arabinose efflux permease